MKKSILIAFFLILGLSISAAKMNVPLKEIYDNPVAYDGKTISIQGYVVSRHKIPFTVIRLYEVFDRTETISVLSFVEGRERKKTEVADFTGKIFYFGGESVVNGTSEFFKEIRRVILENKIEKEGKGADDLSTKTVRLMNKYLKGKKLVLMMIEK